MNKDHGNFTCECHIPGQLYNYETRTCSCKLYIFVVCVLIMTLALESYHVFHPLCLHIHIPDVHEAIFYISMRVFLLSDVLCAGNNLSFLNTAANECLMNPKLCPIDSKCIDLTVGYECNCIQKGYFWNRTSNSCEGLIIIIHNL